MKYILVFACLAIASAYTAATSNILLSLSAVAAAIAFSVVAIAYAGNNPRLLFKSKDGSHSLWAWVLLWPYFLLAWVSFYLYWLTSREAAATEIAPRIWLSRRLSPKEIQTSRVRWDAIIDLAAEFDRSHVAGPIYLSLPVLDGMPPSIEQLRKGIRWMEEHKEDRVLIHCALGHGRSVSLIVAWLIANQRFSTIEECLYFLKSKRPGIGLKKSQLNRLMEFKTQNALVSDQ